MGDVVTFLSFLIDKLCQNHIKKKLNLLRIPEFLITLFKFILRQYLTEIVNKLRYLSNTY